MLDDLPSTPLDPSLGVVDPLVPPSTLYRPADPSPSTYDSAGFNKYARVVNGLLTHLLDDRQMSKANIWALRHLFALAIYAEELKHLPSSESPVFARSVSRIVLQGILDRVQQVATYLLSSTAEENWHTHVTGVLIFRASSSSLDGATQLVIDVVTRARLQDSVRTSRILHMILQHAFRNATKAEADQWMGVVQQMEKLGRYTFISCAPPLLTSCGSPPHGFGYRLFRDTIRA